MSKVLFLPPPRAKRPSSAHALPFVLMNMAITADGKIATADRAISSFSSPHDLAHLYELRATADAVMCGARTAAAEDVHLGPGPAQYRRLRLRRGLAEYNLRVVVSGSGAIAPHASVFQQHSSPILVLTTQKAGKQRLKRLAQVADQIVVCGRQRIDFRSAFAWLRSDWGVQRLLCEGGGELNAALFADRLVNELHLTICPLIFGGRTAPTIAEGRGARQLADALALRLRSCRRVGDELFCVFEVPALGP